MAKSITLQLNTFGRDLEASQRALDDYYITMENGKEPSINQVVSAYLALATFEPLARYAIQSPDKAKQCLRRAYISRSSVSPQNQEKYYNAFLTRTQELHEHLKEMNDDLEQRLSKANLYYEQIDTALTARLDTIATELKSLHPDDDTLNTVITELFGNIKSNMKQSFEYKDEKTATEFSAEISKLIEEAKAKIPLKTKLLDFANQQVNEAIQIGKTAAQCTGFMLLAPVILLFPAPFFAGLRIGIRNTPEPVKQTMAFFKNSHKSTPSQSMDKVAKEVDEAIKKAGQLAEAETEARNKPKLPK